MWRQLRQSAQRGVLGLERPTNIRGESACFVLKVADEPEVLDPLWDGLDVPEHHGDTGLHAETMSFAHDLQIFIGARLTMADFVAHTIRQNLAAAAGDGIQPRLAQTQ